MGSITLEGKNKEEILEAGKNNDGNGQYERTDVNVNKILNKLGEGCSSEAVSGISFHSGDSLRVGMGVSSASKRRRPEREIIDSSSKNKKSKLKKRVEKVLVSSELTLGRDPWSIKKRLFKSDVGNNSRLLLSLKLLETHVFPYWNNDQVAKIEQGFSLAVWDHDTKTQHEMVFKQLNKGANVLQQNWVKSFVNRRNLKPHDVIGLYWDKERSRFTFSVLERA